MTGHIFKFGNKGHLLHDSNIHVYHLKETVTHIQWASFSLCIPNSFTQGVCTETGTELLQKLIFMQVFLHIKSIEQIQTGTIGANQ